MNTNKNSLTPISQNADIQSSVRKGAIVVLFALLLPVLIVILGFCIDYANMLRVRNEAQVVADLSAKAAADTLARSSPDENPVALARQAAKDVAATTLVANFIAWKMTKSFLVERQSKLMEVTSLPRVIRNGILQIRFALTSPAPRAILMDRSIFSLANFMATQTSISHKQQPQVFATSKSCWFLIVPAQ